MMESDSAAAPTHPPGETTLERPAAVAATTTRQADDRPEHSAGSVDSAFAELADLLERSTVPQPAAPGEASADEAATQRTRFFTAQETLVAPQQQHQPELVLEPEPEPEPQLSQLPQPKPISEPANTSFQMQSFVVIILPVIVCGSICWLVPRYVRKWRGRGKYDIVVQSSDDESECISTELSEHKL